jgi:hypothetical protein
MNLVIAKKVNKEIHNLNLSKITAGNKKKVDINKQKSKNLFDGLNVLKLIRKKKVIRCVLVSSRKRSKKKTSY